MFTHAPDILYQQISITYMQIIIIIIIIINISTVTIIDNADKQKTYVYDICISGFESSSRIPAYHHNENKRNKTLLCHHPTNQRRGKQTVIIR